MAASRSAAVVISHQGAVGTPAAFRVDFSSTRSWLMRSTVGEGRTGLSEASRSSPSAETFSNSKVITSTAAAKARSACGSSKSPSVTPAETWAAGLSGSGVRMWQR
jgi:hypothetical protein